MKSSVWKVTRVVVLGVCSVIFFSCSKHTVAYKPEHKTVSPGVLEASVIQYSKANASRSILIDTVKFLKRPIASVFSDNYYNERVGAKTNLFYEVTGYQTKWLYNTEPDGFYYSLLQSLKNAPQYGLNPDDYDVDGIEDAAKVVYGKLPASQLDIMALDIHITEIYFLFTTHLLEGKIRKTGYSDNIWLRDSKKDNSSKDVALLASTNKPEQLETIADKLQPQTLKYAGLQKMLQHYRDLDRYALEALPFITVIGKIDPGQRNKAIPLIRKRVSQFTLKVYPLLLDTLTGIWDSLLYDNSLAQGITALQIMHGLEPDAIIGARTVNFLNQPFNEKAGVIAVNMERMRWTTENKNSEYILVNIPDYKLRIFENEKNVFEMKVIVGAVENPTPVFTDQIEHIVFSPTWTVPTSIISDEIVPRLKSNPSYYSKKNYTFYKNGIEIDAASEDWDKEDVNPYQYRIVQQPGADNSLGRIKFGMTNSMRIYLHDTPGQKLFAKEYRALSHGCIRLDEPARFAEYLLRDQKGWDLEKIQTAMNTGNTSTILLKKDYPVRIEYCTAWVDDSGNINFREDIYGHDKMQLRQLSTPVVKTPSVIAGL